MKTKTKIALAGLLARAVLAWRRQRGLPPHGIFRRGGLLWELDLRQGIDFAIFLFGAFEPATGRFYRRLVRKGDLVLDLGANIGAHTLPLAALAGPSGRVVAFEPTDFAFGKLGRNLALNPAVAARVTPVQAFLVAGEAAVRPEGIPSAWPLRGGEGTEAHAVHGGVFHSLRAATVTTVDAWWRQEGEGRVALVKLDVDGHEMDVLQGAAGLLGSSRPLLLMEFAPYLLPEHGSSFAGLLELLRDLDYEARTFGGRLLPLDSGLAQRIPHGASLNVCLHPR